MTSQILSDIQKSIRQKDEEMSWVDACCLQFAIKSSKGSRNSESCTFQTRDPNVKKEWIVGKFFLVYLFSHFSIHTLLNNFVRQYIVFYQSYVIFRQIAVYIIILALNPNIAQHCLCEMTSLLGKCVILECI